MLDEVLNHINKHARIPLCGMASQYNVVSVFCQLLISSKNEFMKVLTFSNSDTNPINGLLSMPLPLNMENWLLVRDQLAHFPKLPVQQ